MVHHIESEIGPLGNPQRESGIPLGGITQRFEAERDDETLNRIREWLAELGARVAAFSPTTAGAIRDLDEAVAEHGQGAAFGELGGFAALFGRGQQYLSFIRR